MRKKTVKLISDFNVEPLQRVIITAKIYIVKSFITLIFFINLKIKIMKILF